MAGLLDYQNNRLMPDYSIDGIGLLNNLKKGAKDIYKGGEKPRAIVGGLLGGDTTALNSAWQEVKQLADPNYMKNVKGISQDEAFNLALNANPVMALQTGGNVLEALAKPKTQYEIAHEIAQKNAVEMLGLPANNTAMDRAKALGYSSPSDDFYRGSHIPPMSDSGAPMHDLTGKGNVYPDDIYSSNARQYYGTGESTDASLFSKLQSLKNKPDESVRVFRAVPDTVDGNYIHHGDWVTPNRQYAVEHGEGALNGKYKIQASNHPAKTLFTNGDSPYEFGLDRTQTFADAPASLPIMLSKSGADRSKFAAFDPARAHEADLLGNITPEMLGLLAVGSGAGVGYAYNKKERK